MRGCLFLAFEGQFGDPVDFVEEFRISERWKLSAFDERIIGQTLLQVIKLASLKRRAHHRYFSDNDISVLPAGIFLAAKSPMPPSGDARIS